MTREEAHRLLEEWVEDDRLKRHLLSTAYAMAAYAEKFGEDPEKWYITGLLHDLDYEKHPQEHPHIAVKVLREKGLPEDVVQAVLAHAVGSEPRETLLAKALYAVDELTGFLIAVALVMPGKTIREVKWKSVKKKLKDKAFARAVDREHLRKAAEELGVPFEEHVQFVLAAMQAHAEEIGL